MFYKSSHRSTVLDRRASGKNDHDNRVEDEGFGFGCKYEDDYVLEEIARAARAEADSVAATPAPTTPRDRLSTFETELLSAWSEK
jgi:hypothetical protein